MLAEHIGQADLVLPEFRVGVEPCCRGHHHSLSAASLRAVSVVVGEVVQTPGAEFLSVVHRELGHGVEGSHRDRSVAARDAVDPVNQALAPFDILVVHISGVLLRAFDAGFGHKLSQKRRTEAGLAEFHHSLANFRVLGDEGSDSDSALGVAFGHGVDEHHILLNAFEVHCGNVGRAGVDEFAVHLVGEEVQIVFLHKVPDLVHLLLGVEIAGRVVRVADEYGLGPFVDEFFEFLHLRQAEAFVNGGGDGADDRSGGDGEGHVVGVGRFRDYYFVTGVEAAHEGEEHRLGASGRDDDFIAVELYLVALVVVH